MSLYPTLVQPKGEPCGKLRAGCGAPGIIDVSRNHFTSNPRPSARGTCQFQRVGNDSPCKRLSRIVSHNSSTSAKVSSQVGQVSAVSVLRGNQTLAHDLHLCSVIRFIGGAICTLDFGNLWRMQL